MTSLDNLSQHQRILNAAFLGVNAHVREYVLPQYGDYGEDLAASYTVEDCVKQAQRYLTRHGKSSRVGEEQRDMHKAIHWMAMALHKMGGT
jgi:RecA/RadA recombinase